MVSETAIQRVSKQNPCPICGRVDWCTFTATVAFCMRVPSGKTAHNGAYIHKLTNEQPFKNTSSSHFHSLQQPVKAPVVTDDFFQKAMECRYGADLNRLSSQLGVSVQSLERMECGRGIFHVGDNNRPVEAWTFPMRDGNDTVIGIRLRLDSGKKIAAKKSFSGIFIPDLLLWQSWCRLYVCEGPTDCAALLDLGLKAIGRPSCNSGNEILKSYLKNKWKTELVIVADNDEPKQLPNGSKIRPGIAGALKLAQELLHNVMSIRIIKPAGYKDIREWKNSGKLTGKLLDSLVDNTEPITKTGTNGLELRVPAARKANNTGELSQTPCVVAKRYAGTVKRAARQSTATEAVGQDDCSLAW